MTREQILKEAERCVCGQRQQDYGTPEDSFRAIGQLWEVYIKEKCVGTDTIVTVVPEDVAALLALLKIARIATGHGKDDNWVDLAGYAACGGELEASGRPQPVACEHEWECTGQDTAGDLFTCRKCGTLRRIPRPRDVGTTNTAGAAYE